MNRFLGKRTAQLALSGPIAWSLLSGIPTLAQDNGNRKAVETAKTKVFPALVNIVAVRRYFSQGKSHRAPSGGSGVVVTSEGHVLTNFHVAGHTTQLTCTLPNGDSFEAKVVVHDPATDLSVLKLDLSKRPKDAPPVPFAPIGDSSKIRVGDTVLAMGNPLMLSSSVTLGIVSNAARVFTDFTRSDIEDQVLDSGELTGVFTRWIQHDALIQPGNSGGPLVNLEGEVIGINELGGSGMGFAIPSNLAKEILRQGRETGKVRRGWIGIDVLPVEKLGLAKGVLVTGVRKDTPAAKAGIQPGDLLLSVNGSPLNARFFEEVPLVRQRIAELPIGKPATFDLKRGDNVKQVSVSVAEMEPDDTEETEIRSFGISVQPITRHMAFEFDLPIAEGAYVTGVRPGKSAESAKPKLEMGDILISVNRAPVKTIAELRKAVEAAKGEESVVVVRREDEIIVTVLKPEEEPQDEENTELAKPWLGVKTQVLTPDIAKALQVPNQKGHRITQVLVGSEAAKAGLVPGDLLVSMNGAKLNAFRQQDGDDLKQAIENLVVGEKVEFGVLRQKAPIKVAVKLEATPSSAANVPKATQEELEFKVRDLGRLDRMEARWMREVQGVMVVETTPGGVAFMAGLREHDVLLSVEGKPVPNVVQFQAEMKQVLTTKPKIVKLFVQRGGRTQFVLAEPDWKRSGQE